VLLWNQSKCRTNLKPPRSLSGGGRFIILIHLSYINRFSFFFVLPTTSTESAKTKKSLDSCRNLDSCKPFFISHADHSAYFFANYTQNTYILRCTLYYTSTHSIGLDRHLLYFVFFYSSVPIRVLTYFFFFLLLIFFLLYGRDKHNIKKRNPTSSIDKFILSVQYLQRRKVSTLHKAFDEYRCD
jgi:hypothetical protein